jgi:hypothetical protein
MREFKISGLSLEETRELIPHSPIIVGYVGSIAHDMFVPSSDPDSIDDKDIMAVTVAPPEAYIGLSNFESHRQWIREYDSVTYEFKKYVRLLLKCNPNVLGLLWNRQQHYIYTNFWGEQLIENRDIFVSKAIYRSFTGYAYGQLKRMESFTKEGYMGEKRKALVEKHGYDTKNAAHLIRLLRMGIEFLNEGELHVARHDREELLSIKRGEWQLERVKGEAERLFKRAEEAYDRCTLPARPDFKRAEKLVTQVLYDYIR